jgi:hypothetical protein
VGIGSVSPLQPSRRSAMSCYDPHGAVRASNCENVDGGAHGLSLGFAILTGGNELPPQSCRTDDLQSDLDAAERTLRTSLRMNSWQNAHHDHSRSSCQSAHGENQSIP